MHVLTKWSESSRYCLSPKGEFIGCSDMSLDVQKQHVSSNAGSCQQPLTEKIGERVMGKCKKDPKYNVLSIRITDDEKAFMEAMKRSTRKNISTLLREAMQQYTPQLKGAFKQGN